MYHKAALAVLLLAAAAFPCFAQPQAANETTVVFKFHARNNRFYERGNSEEINRLYDFVERNKLEITTGNMPIHVNGYCASFNSERKNLQTARTRSSRVKSELIVNKGLKEEHFITANHAESFEGQKDVVVISFVIAKATPEAIRQPQPKQKHEPPKQPEPEPEVQPQPVIAIDSEAIRQPTPQWTKFSLRTNLLYWLATVPNLGIEYRPTATLGVLLNGGWSHWIWSDEDKQHRTWFAQPELRYYLGANQSWFIGLEAHAAQYNFKFNDAGYQGNAYGGGIIGGYCLVLNKCLDMDFSLGLGYTQLHYDSYFRSNGYMVKKETDIKKSVFAPTQAGVSLIWKIK
jgi:hypothetical protein